METFLCVCVLSETVERLGPSTQAVSKYLQTDGLVTVQRGRGFMVLCLSTVMALDSPVFK